jgi:hypothetical protein
MSSSLIFDFDGVLTKVGMKEKLQTKCIAELAELSEKPFDEVLKDYNIAKEHVFANPTKFGWMQDNKIIVDFVDEDPFGEIIGTMHRMEETGYNKAIKSRYGSVEALQYNNFKQTYSHDNVEMVHNIAESLKAACEVFDLVSILTNSDPSKVSKFMEKYNTGVSVSGFAMKHYVKPHSIEELPEYINIEGRNVAIQRPEYFKGLKALEKDRTIMIGDSFSIDLALPFAMGYEIVLKENDYTANWSKRFVGEKGTVINDLMQASKL